MEGGILQGSAVDIFLRMFAVAKPSKIAVDVEVLHWSYEYCLAQTQENSVLFVATHTLAREQLFKWVGPLLPRKISVIHKKAKNLHPKSLKELNNFRIQLKSNVICNQINMPIAGNLPTILFYRTPPN